jgi:hypothetical protein
MGMNIKLNMTNQILLLKYDRSGRSSGVAIISFETPAEAARAKKQFEGKLAKGLFRMVLGPGVRGLAVTFGQC